MGILVLMKGSSGRSVGAQGAPTISQSAAEQIAQLYAMKNSLTATQKKIGSRLLVARQKANGTLPQSLSSLRTDVDKDNDGNPLVDISVTNRTAVYKRLDQLGVKVVNAVGRNIRAYVPFSQLETVAGYDGVVAVREAAKAKTNRITMPGGAKVDVQPGYKDRAAQMREKLQAALLKSALANTMVVNVSEGDKTHRAFDARNGFGFDGTGVKIGVLSDGVDSLAGVQATGDLPAVTVLPGQAGSGDEGTAMLEIVHDLAPGAQLYFATAFNGITSFAQNIRDLRTAGCDIIVDDVIYFAESSFQDGQAGSVTSPTNGGVVTQAVNDVTASGALYFSSAGNQGNKDDNTSATWEGNFVASTGTLPAVLTGAGTPMTFSGGANLTNQCTLSMSPVLMQWSDPLGGSGNDYDMFDLNAGLTTVFDFSADVQDGDDDPIEIFGPMFTNEQLIVVKFSGADRFISIHGFVGGIGAGFAINTPGSTFGHSCAANAFGVAATPAAGAIGGGNPSGPSPNPFTTANVTERFSSDGPRTLFFQPNGALIGSGPLSGQGLVRQKPDITAADGVMTAAPGFNPFFGTSAAAPHAAAIAGLLKSFNPALTPTQIRNALVSTALDIETAGTDRDSGAGIIMAFQALQSLGAQPIANVQQGTVSTNVTAGDADGAIEPCERFDLTIPLNNTGPVTATNISATLTSSTPGVTIVQGTSAYPNIAGGGSANNTTPFTAILSCNAACGLTLNFTLTVTYTGGPSPKVFNFSILTGGTGGAPMTFSFTGPPVSIPDSPGANTPGAAAMATLNVAGLPGGVGDVNFRFNGTACNTTAGSTTVGLDHSFVNDLEIKLKSPSGTEITIINRTDGSGNNFCNTVLDDETANPSIQTVATANAPFTGTFKPANSLSAFMD